MPVKDIISYLEKQKDLDKMIVVSPEVWDKAINDAFENGKKEGEKQKEQVVDREGMYYYDGKKFIYCGYPAIEENPYDFAMSQQEKQKEQKPISTEDMPYITDEHFYEREPADSFKYKLAEYMTKCCTKKEGPYGYEYGISAESILKMAEEELLKRGVVQKPAEWSEEDENIRKALIWHLKADVDFISNGVTKAECLAYLDKQKVQKQEWGEEDETRLTNTLIMLKEYAIHHYSKDDVEKSVDWLENRLKFFRSPQDRCKDCPHRGDMFLLTQGIKSGKHELASEFMNYLDENRPYGKMSLSNAECEDIDKAFEECDWAKILKYVEKYRSSWKPSEEDIKMLEHIIGQYETGNKNSKVMGYLPRVEELSFLKKVLAKWKN